MTYSSIAFIGLNPSTADEAQNDPTVSRCIKYAQRWGYGHMVMLNLFGYRSTDPKGLIEYARGGDAVGQDNNLSLWRNCRLVSAVVCCWGAFPEAQARRDDLRELFESFEIETPVFSLGVTKAGAPRHPLYLRRDVKPMPFEI